MPQGKNFVVTQDHETVVIRGKANNVASHKKTVGPTETRARYDGTKSAADRKLDDATDVVRVQRINPSIKNAIIKARTAQKLSQKDLAKRAQIQPQVLQSYENGKGKADVKVLQKLERILKVKFTGKQFNGINI